VTVGVTENPAIVIAVVALALIFLRQFTARRVRATAYLWAAFLLVIGLVPPGPVLHPTVATVALLVISLCASIAFGVLRGRQIPVWRDGHGVILRRGDATTLLLWPATIATRLVLAGLGYVAFAEPIELNALWLGLGLSLAAQQLFTARRATALAAM
jgi:hypothetical protein